MLPIVGALVRTVRQFTFAMLLLMLGIGDPISPENHWLSPARKTDP